MVCFKQFLTDYRSSELRQFCGQHRAQVLLLLVVGFVVCCGAVLMARQPDSPKAKSGPSVARVTVDGEDLVIIEFEKDETSKIRLRGAAIRLRIPKNIRAGISNPKIAEMLETTMIEACGVHASDLVPVLTCNGFNLVGTDIDTDNLKLDIVANEKLNDASYLSMLITIEVPESVDIAIKCDALVQKTGEVEYGKGGQRRTQDTKRAVVTWYGPVLLSP